MIIFSIGFITGIISTFFFLGIYSLWQEEKEKEQIRKTQNTYCPLEFFEDHVEKMSQFDEPAF